MGRYFVSDVLAAVTALPDVNARLAAMQKLDLIHLDKGSGEFHFKHALVRDALYAGLLTGLRRTLHFKIAAEIERRNANRLVEVVEILAHHYSQSGCTDKAVEFLALSGAKSLGINSLDEAEQFLRTGLVLARSADPARMDPQVAGMLVDLAKTLRLKFQANQIIRLLEPELTKIEALGEIEAVPILLNFYAVALFQVCRFLEGKRVQNKALALAERLQDDKSLAYSRTGHLLLSTVIDPLPLREFARFAEQALRESERTEDIYLMGWTIWVVAWNYVHRGLKVEGHELATRLMKRGQESRDPRSIGAALWLFGWLDILVENYASALANGAECVQRALTPFDRQIGYLIVGSAKLLMGQITEGFETIKRWRDESLANGYHYTALATEVPFSVGMALSGEFKKGVRWLEGVIERCETQYCYQFYADFARLHLAEMYLALLRPKERPPLQLLLKNPMFLMYARVMARWKAEELLNAASRNKTFSNEGVFRARIDFDFAQLYIATNKLDLARKHLERALMVAARQSAFPLIARVDAAIAAL